MNTQTEIEIKAVSIPTEAKSILVVDNESFERAGHLLKVIKDLRFKINETFDPIIKKAHEAHKEAVAQKKKIEAPLTEAEGIVKPRLAAYHEEQERKAREEQARLQAELNKKAEEEKLQLALRAEGMGSSAQAEAILAQPVITEKVVVGNFAPKVAGISFRETWSAEVLDEDAFFKGVFEGVIPRAAVSINTTFLNQQARSLKASMKYPGVCVSVTKNTASSRG